MEIFDLMDLMEESGASDLHISPHSPPILRINGQLRRCKLDPLSPEDVHFLIYGILTDHQRSQYEEKLELDLSTEFEGIGRFRVNVFRSYYGDTAVLRSISDKCFSFEELGLPNILKELVLKDRGLLLLTGPTGCGKSTTMSTLIDTINQTVRRHILTIEDPVEYIHKSNKSLINQREIGKNSHSFASALRSAMREDPDVIVVAEMRDLETTSLAITAAETGHLVLGTLHTNSATKTLNRIIDQYPPDQQEQIRVMVSESILGIASQVLLPKLEGGRVAAFEVLVRTHAVSNIIRKNNTFQLPSVIQTNSDKGMITMEQSMQNLVQEGLVAKEIVDDYIAEIEN